jgi:hypothetical protein
MAGWPPQRDRPPFVSTGPSNIAYCLLLTDISDKARTDFVPELFPAFSRLLLATGESAVLQCMAGNLSLPSSFGQFEVAGSTTSCFAMQ